MDNVTMTDEILRRGYIISNVQAGDMPEQTLDLKYNLLMLCYEGEATFEMNMKQVKLTAHSRLSMGHVMLLRVISVSPDFKGIVMAMTDKFGLETLSDLNLRSIDGLFRHPVKQVDDPNEWTLLSNFMQNLRIYSELPSCYRVSEVASSIFRCMILSLYSIEVLGDQPVVEKENAYSTSDNYFRKFMSLVFDNVKREHEVSFYAAQLHITTKYLSEVCKQKSGRKAKEIISLILVSKIKMSIKFSGMSMKEIAYEYNFADQSSLGKFFKKTVGVSPLAYRNGDIKDFE